MPNALFSKIFAGNRVGIRPISDANYTTGWQYLGPTNVITDDHDFVMRQQDEKSKWLYDAIGFNANNNLNLPDTNTMPLAGVYNVILGSGDTVLNSTTFPTSNRNAAFCSPAAIIDGSDNFLSNSGSTVATGQYNHIASTVAATIDGNRNFVFNSPTTFGTINDSIVMSTGGITPSGTNSKVILLGVNGVTLGTNTQSGAIAADGGAVVNSTKSVVMFANACTLSAATQSVIDSSVSSAIVSSTRSHVMTSDSCNIDGFNNVVIASSKSVLARKRNTLVMGYGTGAASAANIKIELDAETGNIYAAGTLSANDLLINGLPIANQLNNLTATTNPTVNDDSADGYTPLSMWVNTTTNEIWMAISVAPGAANWQIATLTVDQLGNLALINGTTVGQNIVQMANPSAVSFVRINADNTVSALSAGAFVTAIDAVTISGAQTITGAKVFTTDIIRNAAAGQASIVLQQAGVTNGRISATGGAGADVGVYAQRFSFLDGVSGSVLNHNGVSKLYTSSTGVDVIGNVNVTGAGNLSNTVRQTATGSGAFSIFEALSSRNDSNTTFQGRYGAAFRRTDGTAIVAGQSVGAYMFGAQFGSDTSYQPTKIRYSASIQGVAGSGTFADANNMPIDIVFRVGTVGDDINAANVGYGTEKMRLVSNGNLILQGGIIEGNGTGQRIHFINGGDTGASGGAATYYQNNGATQGAIGSYSSIAGTGYDPSLAIWSGSKITMFTGSTAKHTFHTNGNVSIGSTGDNALALLQVAGAMRAAGNILAGGGVVAAAGSGFLSDSSVPNVQNPIWRIGNATSYGMSYFQGSSGYDGTDSLGFHFGTPSSAGSPLNVRPQGIVIQANNGASPNYSTAQIVIRSGGANPAALGFWRDALTAVYLSHRTTDLLELYSANGDYGDLRVRTFTCATWTAVSDIALKENVEELSLELCKEILAKVKWYNFDMIDGQKNLNGVIAQELIDIYPDAVMTNSDGTYSVNYNLLYNLQMRVSQDLEQRLARLEAILLG